MNDQPLAPIMTARASELYRRVLRSLPSLLEDHALGLGLSVRETRAQVEGLTALGLVRVDDQGRLRADDPRASMGRMLDTEEASLDTRRAALLALRESMHSYEIDYRRGLQLSGPRVPPWEPVAESEAAAVIEHLVRSSDGPVLRVVQRIGPGPVGGAPGWPDGERRERRTIVPLAVLTDQAWLLDAEGRAATGEAQRYLHEVPVDFAVFGRAGVLLAEPGHADGGYLLIRPRTLSEVFVALFEQLWRQAEPVHVQDAPRQDLKLLKLLALGFKDEAIARQLGLGLRTVRRHVSALMEEHGADTRFQLGMAVSRRGLLG